MAERVDLSASRNIDPWALTLEFEYTGSELPPISSIDMEVRLYPGQPGAAKLVVDNIDYEDVAEGDHRILRLFLEAPQADLEIMPTGLNEPESGEADLFAYDIVITYADAVEEKLAWGDFLLEPGVTRWPAS